MRSIRIITPHQISIHLNGKANKISFPRVIKASILSNFDVLFRKIHQPISLRIVEYSPSCHHGKNRIVENYAVGHHFKRFIASRSDRLQLFPPTFSTDYGLHHGHSVLNNRVFMFTLQGERKSPGQPDESCFSKGTE